MGFDGVRLLGGLISLLSLGLWDLVEFRCLLEDYEPVRVFSILSLWPLFLSGSIFLLGGFPMSSYVGMCRSYFYLDWVSSSFVYLRVLIVSTSFLSHW